MATTLTYTDMILIYPQFTSESVEQQTRITTFIQIADRQISNGASLFGDNLDTVILTLAAHNLSIGNRDNESNAGGAGAVTARTTGEQITSYSVQTRSDRYDVYRTTPYGQAYLQFIQSLNLTPFVA